MGVKIVVVDREPIGLALRRFRKLLERRGVTSEIRQHLYYAKESERRRRKHFAKRFKARLATLKAKEAGEMPTASITDDFRAFRKKTGKP